MDEPIPRSCHVDAWRPKVPGITEVFHAHIVDYSYPPHCHDTWTLIIVDAGAISYELDTRHCGAAGQTVALLPPGVVHDGRPAESARSGFWKRNLYLESDFLPIDLVGPAVEHTNLADPQLRSALSGLHDSLLRGEESLDGETRLGLIAERVQSHLDYRRIAIRSPEKTVAVQLREVLETRLLEPISLKQVASSLGRSVPHMIRSFRSTFGISPYAYVIGRRVEIARSMLLTGMMPAQVATSVGFYDQSHFTRHFKRHTSVSPARFAASHFRRDSFDLDYSK